MADLAGISGGILAFLGGTMKFVLIFVVLLVCAFVFLTVKRNRKFSFPCYIHIQIAEGKDDMYITKAGWFKKNRKFGGRIEMGGEYEMVTKENYKIFNFSSDDYHFVNGKKCIHTQRDSDDPEVLVPIQYYKMDDKSKKMISTIAPADYRDTACQILEKKQEEMNTWWDKNGAIIINAVVIMACLIMVIVITQYASGQYDKATDLLKYIADKTSGGVISTTAP